MLFGESKKSKLDFHLVKQSIKWLVYTLLLLNFYFYIMEDVENARHALASSASFLKWIQAFSTSIDFFAWLLLILVYELDTYILEEQDLTSVVRAGFSAIRIICYLFILNTAYVYGLELYQKYHAVDRAEHISSLCEVAADEISFVSNLEYTYVTSENCSELGSGSDYFILDEGLVITDRVNLQQERLFALMDFIEALCWLIIVVLIEIDIRIQTRGVDSLTLTKTSSYVKLMAYITIFCLAIYWALTGHLLYFWDELLWIGGFAAIEMNVAEWREEILEENSLA